MAEKSKPEFTLGDLGTIKEGILAEEAGFKPFERFGSDFTLRPETVFGALPFVGGLINIGQAIGKYKLEDSANKFYGVDKGLRDTSISSGMNDSATNSLIKEIKAFKDNDPYSTTSNITRDDIQNFMMQKKPDLDLAPIQNRMYTQKQLDNRTTDFYKPEQVYSTQPFSSGAEYRSSGFKGDYNAPEFLMTETGKFDAPTGRTYSQAFQSGDLDRGLKSVSDFAGEGVVNFGTIDRKTGEFKGAKGYDPAFARAVTRESQGDTANAESTFICTALYEMGQMPIGIYKYDQRYGQQVNKKIYNGYAIWGKPIAQKMRNRGFIYNIITPIAMRWAEQMAFDMSDGKVGKKRYSIKAMKFLGEAICYGIGLFIKPEGEKHGSNRNRQHGEERRTIRGEDGLQKRRGRPRTKRRTAS
jgi:hypothetical protein